MAMQSNKRKHPRLLKRAALLGAALLTCVSALAQQSGGFVAGEHSELVTETCSRCHSAALVTQNSGSREVWELRVNLMQSAHGMPKIDAEKQAAILDYLEANYGQKATARRAALKPEFMPPNPYATDSADD